MTNQDLHPYKTNLKVQTAHFFL